MSFFTNSIFTTITIITVLDTIAVIIYFICTLGFFPWTSIFFMASIVVLSDTIQLIDSYPMLIWRKYMHHIRSVVGYIVRVNSCNLREHHHRFSLLPLRYHTSSLLCHTQALSPCRMFSLLQQLHCIRQSLVVRRLCHRIRHCFLLPQHHHRLVLLYHTQALWPCRMFSSPPQLYRAFLLYHTQALSQYRRFFLPPLQWHCTLRVFCCTQVSSLYHRYFCYKSIIVGFLRFIIRWFRHCIILSFSSIIRWLWYTVAYNNSCSMNNIEFMLPETVGTVGSTGSWFVGTTGAAANTGLLGTIGSIGATGSVGTVGSTGAVGFVEYHWCCRQYRLTRNYWFSRDSWFRWHHRFGHAIQFFLLGYELFLRVFVQTFVELREYRALFSECWVSRHQLLDRYWREHFDLLWRFFATTEKSILSVIFFYQFLAKDNKTLALPLLPIHQTWVFFLSSSFEKYYCSAEHDNEQEYEYFCRERFVHTVYLENIRRRGVIFRK